MKAVSLFGWLVFNYKSISYLKKKKYPIKLDCGGVGEDTASPEFNVHAPWTTWAFSCLLQEEDFLTTYPTLSSQPLRFWDVVCSGLIKGDDSVLYFLVKGPSPHTEAPAPLPSALESTVCNEKIDGAFLIFPACVFLIIFPWMQSSAFVPKPHKAGPCSSQSKEDFSRANAVGRAKPPGSRAVKTPSSVFRSARLCSDAFTPQLPLCWPPNELPHARLLPLTVLLVDHSKTRPSWSKLRIVLQPCSRLHSRSLLLTWEVRYFGMDQ